MRCVRLLEFPIYDPQIINSDRRSLTSQFRLTKLAEERAKFDESMQKLHSHPPQAAGQCCDGQPKLVTQPWRRLGLERQQVKLCTIIKYILIRGELGYDA